MNINFKRFRLGLAAVAASATIVAAAPNSAMADAIFDFSASTGPNQQGTAHFDFSAPNTFTLTLTNTGTIVDISGVLDGLSFSLPGTLTGITLTAINSPDGVVDCTSGVTCVDSSPGAQPTSDYAVSHSANAVTLDAGSGFHPFGVVNDTIDANAGLDGLRNAQHNPYLEGPVTFSFTTTGETSLPTTLSNVSFQFGTVPANVPGTGGCTNCTSVPEPGSLAIFGTTLIILGGVGYVARRRREDEV